MFDIHMLPADHGDCLWIDYGDEAAPRHILIDAGTTGTWPRLRKKIDDERAKNNGKLHFELFVITHIDADHIGGSIKFLEECGPMGVTFGEVWFNGWHQLDNEAPPDVLGAMQGEALTALIDSHNFKWNEKFGRRAVMVPDSGALPSVSYAGMQLTLLSPTFEKLQKLKPDWEKEVVNAGLKPGQAYDVEDVETPSDELGDDVEDMANGKFEPDKTKPNGSSIAFIAEYDGKRVLFGADAHPDVLLASLKRGPLAHADDAAARRIQDRASWQQEKYQPRTHRGVAGEALSRFHEWRDLRPPEPGGHRPHRGVRAGQEGDRIQLPYRVQRGVGQQVAQARLGPDHALWRCGEGPVGTPVNGKRYRWPCVSTSGSARGTATWSHVPHSGIRDLETGRRATLARDPFEKATRAGQGIGLSTISCADAFTKPYFAYAACASGVARNAR